MAHCDEYIELISANLDGALSPAERERLETHLASCPECKALYEELTAVHAALGGLPPVEVPADLHDRIMKAVAAEQVLPLAPAEKKKAPRPWQRWLASAAVLAVVLVGAWSWKPWEHNTAKDLTLGSPAPAAMQNPMPDRAEMLPEASMSAAAPEAAFTDNSDSPTAGASETAPAPEPTTEYTEATEDTLSLKEKAATFDGVSSEGAADMEAIIAPQMFRMTSESVISGDSGEPALPAEVPEETGVPETQSFMVTAMLPSNETATPVEMTAREALDRLLAEYPKPGCETWEYGEIEPGWQSPEWITTDGSTGWLAYYGFSEDEGHIVSYSFDAWFLSPEGELICTATFVIPTDGGEIQIAGA